MALKYEGMTRINNLVNKTGDLIDSNPLFEEAGEVTKIREGFEAVQEALKEDSVEKKQGLLASLFSSFLKTGEDFHYKSFEGKINSIFRQFDLSKESVEAIAKNYTTYAKELKNEVESLSSFIEDSEKLELDKKDAGYLGDLKIQLNNLTLSLTRVELSRDSAIELSEKMESSRGIFQTSLSACLLEVGGQKILRSGNEIFSTMNTIAEGLSTTLTENTVKMAKLTSENVNRPLLSSPKIQENFQLLETTLGELEKTKEKILTANEIKKGTK